MSIEGVVFLMFMVGFSIAVISGKRWSYLVLLALIGGGLCLIGYKFCTDVFAFDSSDNLAIMLMLLVPTFVTSVVGFYVRFQVSLRLMLLQVGLVGLAMLVFLAPHLLRVRAGGQLEDLLAKRQMPAPHFHSGRICGVLWRGPITDAEFSLIQRANPVNELSFEGTELTPEQTLWFENWKTTRHTRGNHASK